MVEHFTVISCDKQGFYTTLEGEGLTYDETKKVLKELLEDDDYLRNNIIIPCKEYSLKYFGFKDEIVEEKKKVTIDYNQGKIFIEDKTYDLNEETMKMIKDTESYTISEIIGHPVPEGKCLDEFIV